MDFLICDGSNWRSSIYFRSGGGVIIDSLSGQPAPTVTGSVSNLTDLDDVDTTGVGDGDCLAYNNSAGEWEASSSCGSGGGGASAINDLTDVDTTGFADGNVLMYSAGASGWVPGTASGGGTPGGNTTEVQFNSGGSFNGDSNFVWDAANAKLIVNGDISYTGFLDDISDRRLKENIAPLENSLAGIMSLRGYSFSMKSDPAHEIEYGLMAQDVQPVFPELVKTKDDGHMSLNYIGLFGPMVEAMKTQQRTIETQQAAIEAQQAVIEAQQKTTDDLNRRLKALERVYGTGMTYQEDSQEQQSEE